VARLRPVSFQWKDRDVRDLGFVAEEVAEIDPLLATYNDQGEIEGVKYRQLTAVLVNAIQEQQVQIAALRQQITAQDRENIRVTDLQSKLEAYRLTMVEQMALMQAELHQLRDQVSRQPAELRVALDD